MIMPGASVQSKPVGKKVLLTCRAQDDRGLISQLEWLDPKNDTIKNDNRLTKDRLSVERMTPDTLSLIFSAIKETEAGTYTCRAVFANTQTLAKSVRIDTIYAITWIDAPEEQFPIMGSKYKVKCKVQANPAPIVDWLRNGQQIISGSNNRYVVDSDVLVIQNVTEEDDGIYICRAIVLDTGELSERNIKVEEKIGVVKKMLAAHSEVFRAQLLSRQWESKEPEKIKDILPDTFKNLLRFVYGFDTTAVMSFEDADDLLYAADRYIMSRLKNKLATRLMSLLDHTNICSLLTNPACSSVLELHSEMTKILQTETDKVLASPQFLSCCPETFVKILEQEVMNVPELEVWRAAVKWAKNKDKREDKESLCQHLEKPLQHIRVCTLTLDEFCKEVVPTGILNTEEVGAVCISVVSKNKPHNLTSVCNNMEVRKTTVQRVKSAELSVNLNRKAGRCYVGDVREFSFCVQTLHLDVEVMRLRCWGWDEGQFTMTVRIAPQNTSQTGVTTLTHTSICTGTPAMIPISTEETPVLLSRDTKYLITLSCDTQFYVDIHPSSVYREQHFTLELTPYEGRYGTPATEIFYKTLSPQ